MNYSSSHPQNIKCGWTGCTHRFGSEIDMNMHVMMNHLIILDHGEFLLNRKASSRKRSAKESEPQLQLQEPVHVSKKAPDHPQPHKFPVKAATPKPVKIPQNPVNLQLPLPNPLLAVQNDRNSDIQQVFGILAGNPAIFDTLKQDIESASSNLTGVPGIVENSSKIPIERAGTSNSKETNDDRESLEQERPLEMEMEHRIDGEDEIEVQIRPQSVLNLDQLLPPRQMSDVVDEFLERLKPMKQLGFIRPNRSVYCIVCLKYVRSFHECNWRHTPSEDRVAEMWYRRFGPEKPTGKNQLMRELEEIKTWLQSEEDDGIIQDT